MRVAIYLLKLIEVLEVLVAPSYPGVLPNLWYGYSSLRVLAEHMLKQILELFIHKSRVFRS